MGIISGVGLKKYKSVILLVHVDVNRKLRLNLF